MYDLEIRYNAKPVRSTAMFQYLLYDCVYLENKIFIKHRFWKNKPVSISDQECLVPFYIYLRVFAVNFSTDDVPTRSEEAQIGLR